MAVRRLMATLALLGSATRLEYTYRPVTAVREETAWGQEQKHDRLKKPS